MATKAQKVKVGVFILVAAGLTLAVILVSAGLYATEGVEYYILFEESVLGLNEGSLVEYLGVPVGRVSNITVTDDNRAHVTVRIDSDKVELHEGVNAQLVIYSLAAGSMAVSLEGGASDAPALSPGDQIPAKPSTLTAVSGQIEDVMDDFRSIMNSVQTGLKGMEEGDLAKVVEKVDTLLTDAGDFVKEGKNLVAQANDTVGAIREDAQKVIEEAASISEDVGTLAKEMNALVTTINTKVGQFDVAKTQDNLNRVLDNIGNLSEKLDRTVGQFDDISANVMHEADNIEYSLRTTLKEMAQTLDAARVLVQDLQRNPSAIVRGRASTTGDSQ